jgi:YebC/PmpR family DNA-binding regulatory protein
MAVKAGGSNPDSNPRLRAAIQNAKSYNMPKDRVEAAIKKAMGKDEKDLEVLTYEGYGPHGVAVLVETATDNPTRTVANIRSYFNKFNGSLGTTGSVDYLFDHKCIFRIKKTESLDPETLELDLIDAGCEELSVDGDEIIIYGAFDSFGNLQNYFETNSIEIISSDFDRIPTVTKKLSGPQKEELNKLLDKIEDDDDVQNVYSNME